MENLHIREPKDSDVKDISSLMEQLGYPINIQGMKHNLLHYLTLPNQKVYVAEKDSRVIGCVAMAIVHYLHREASFLRIVAMIVDKDYRNQGIGKKLMQEVENYAKKKRCSHIELSSGIHRKELGSHEFYKTIGFIELNKLKKYFGKKLKNTEK